MLETDSPGGRRGFCTGPSGDFQFCALPGELSVFGIRPPSGSYMSGADYTSQRYTIPAGREEYELVLRTKGVFGRLASVRGKLLRLDGTPAAAVTVYPVAMAPFESMATSSYIHPTSTNADGTFEVANVPGGLALGLYAETADRRLAFASRPEIGATGRP